MRNDARLLAYSILYQFNNDIKLDLILNKAFIDNKSDLRSRSRANVLVNDIVRLRGRLDLMIKYVSGRKIKQIQRHPASNPRKIRQAQSPRRSKPCSLGQPSR